MRRGGRGSYRDESHDIGEGLAFDLELPCPQDFLFDPCIIQARPRPA